MAVELEPLRAGLYLEALTVSDDAIWYSDVIEGGVRKLSLDGEELGYWLPERSFIGALLLNEDGKLLISGPGGIVWLDPESGASGVLIEAVDGVPLGGVNEMVADAEGGIYFGTVDLPSIMKGERPQPAMLCHLGIDGRVRKLAEGLTFSNGVAISVDGATFYHNESFSGVSAYAVEADGSLGEKRWFLEKYDCDGMALDTDGNAWVSGFTLPDLLCLGQDGSVQQKIELPGVAATNIRFGGDGRNIYLCTVTAESAAELAKGVMPSEWTSRLCRLASPVVGVPAHRARFRLG